VLTLALCVLVVIVFGLAMLTRRPHAREGPPRGVLFAGAHAEAVEAEEPGRPPVPIWAIAVVGVVSWFVIDLALSLLRPSLPATVRSLDGRHHQITAEPGIETLPALSPDGQWLAYRSDAEGTGDIMIRRIGEDTAQNLTRELHADESDPAFSPDGQQLAFRSSYQNGGIYIVNRSGGAVRRMTNFGASPAWTPDGAAIVFATRSSAAPRGGASPGEAFTPPGVGAGTSAGWIVHLSTGALTRLSRGDFRQPAVSPDGRRIAYWSAPHATSNRSRGWDHGLRTITVEGRGAILVSPTAATDWNPVWSPDGKFLYFLSDRDGRVAIWRVAMNRRTGTASGPPVRMALQADRAAWLAISRQGRHLAWATAEWRPTLLRIDYDADARTTRGTPAAIDTGLLPPRCSEPSPDESMLAFASDQHQPDIYVAGPGGRGLRAITTDSAMEGCPRWSPDGRRIAFHSNAGRASRIWTANADGTGLRELASAGGDLVHPVWAPDGQSLVAWNRSQQALHLVWLGGDGAVRAAGALPSLPHTFTPTGWSPDGSRIAGTALGAVWIYSTARRTYDRLVAGASPTWLSSSRRLVYVSDGRLILLDVPTRFTREILAIPDLSLDAPFLSPDDRHLYFSRNAPEANIWVVELE
jgi:Tol biopolymer transport system component